MRESVSVFRKHKKMSSEDILDSLSGAIKSGLPPEWSLINDVIASKFYRNLFLWNIPVPISEYFELSSMNALIGIVNVVLNELKSEFPSDEMLEFTCHILRWLAKESFDVYIPSFSEHEDAMRRLYMDPGATSETLIYWLILSFHMVDTPGRVRRREIQHRLLSSTIQPTLHPLLYAQQHLHRLVPYVVGDPNLRRENVQDVLETARKLRKPSANHAFTFGWMEKVEQVVKQYPALSSSAKVGYWITTLSEKLSSDRRYVRHLITDTVDDGLRKRFSVYLHRVYLSMTVPSHKREIQYIFDRFDRNYIRDTSKILTGIYLSLANQKVAEGKSAKPFLNRGLIHLVLDMLGDFE